MIGQVLSSRASRAQTKEAGVVRDPANISQHRQKGVWSFLTWAFFISQVLGMQQAFAASARVEAAADNASEDSGADPAQAASSPLQPLGRFTGGETIAHDAAPMGEAPMPNVAPIVAGAAREVVGGDSQELYQAASAPHSAVAHATEALDKAPSAPVQSAIEIGGPLGPTLPPIVVEVIPPIIGEVIPPVIEEVIAPVIDTVEDILATLDPVLDQVVAPVAALAGDVIQAIDPVLDQVIAPVAALAGDVIQAIDPVLEPVIAPVAALAGDVIQAIDPVLDPVIAPVAALAGDVILAIDPVLDQVIAPVAALAGDVIQAVDDAASGGEAGGSVLNLLLSLEVSGEQPIAVVSGSMVYPEEASASASLNPDDLFSGGSYTEYSIVLQSETPAGSGLVSISSTAAPSSLLDQVLGGLPDDLPGEPDQAINVTLPSAIQEIVLHGNGLGLGGFSL